MNRLTEEQKRKLEDLVVSVSNQYEFSTVGTVVDYRELDRYIEQLLDEAYQRGKKEGEQSNWIRIAKKPNGIWYVTTSNGGIECRSSEKALVFLQEVLAYRKEKNLNQEQKAE